MILELFIVALMLNVKCVFLFVSWDSKLQSSPMKVFIMFSLNHPPSVMHQLSELRQPFTLVAYLYEEIMHITYLLPTVTPMPHWNPLDHIGIVYLTFCMATEYSKTCYALLPLACLLPSLILDRYYTDLFFFCKVLLMNAVCHMDWICKQRYLIESENTSANGYMINIYNF